MQLRSAQNNGCKGSIASAIPALRACSSSSPRASRTMSRAPCRSRAPCGSPPTLSSKHCAESSTASSMARRTCSIASRRGLRSSAGSWPASPRLVEISPRSRNWRLRRGLLSARLTQLCMPQAKTMKRMSGTGLDDLTQIALRLQRCGIQCQQSGVGRLPARDHRLPPQCRITDQERRCSPTRTIFMVLVPPEVPIGSPMVSTMMSPSCTAPCATSTFSASSSSSSRSRPR